MKYQLFFIPFYAIYTISTHIDKNNSDVVITYTGHNEADRVLGSNLEEKISTDEHDVHLMVGDTSATEHQSIMRCRPTFYFEHSHVSVIIQGYRVPKSDKIDKDQTKEAITLPFTEANEVVFIPNEREVIRNEEYSDMKMHDLMENTNIRNVMKQVNTESPAQDIVFITGKNNENLEKTVKERPQHQNAERPFEKIKMRLDCKHLDCNNTMDSVCGGKVEDGKWKYRMFLNECFFRKVNCAFKYPSNRYSVVLMDHCKNIGGRVLPKSNQYIPSSNQDVRKDTRRSFISRRTLNMGVDGSFCAHACPEHCTEDYDPQCAVSASGERRVFINHCKLDFHSCLYGAVWQRRPLSECVGGKKADMRQNRGFIGWLQRVGIVDKRGRLMLT